MPTCPSFIGKEAPSLRRQSVNVDVFPLITNAKRNLPILYYSAFKTFSLLESFPINYTREARNTESFFNGSWRYGLRFNAKLKKSVDVAYIGHSNGGTPYSLDARFRAGFSVGHTWKHAFIEKKLFLTYGLDAIGEYSIIRSYSDFIYSLPAYSIYNHHFVMLALSPELALRYDITSNLSLELGFSIPFRWQTAWKNYRTHVGLPGGVDPEHLYYTDVKAHEFQIYFRPLLRLYYFF